MKKSMKDLEAENARLRLKIESALCLLSEGPDVIGGFEARRLASRELMEALGYESACSLQQEQVQFSKLRTALWNEAERLPNLCGWTPCPAEVVLRRLAR